MVCQCLKMPRLSVLLSAALCGVRFGSAELYGISGATQVFTHDDWKTTHTSEVSLTDHISGIAIAGDYVFSNVHIMAQGAIMVKNENKDQDRLIIEGYYISDDNLATAPDVEDYDVFYNFISDASTLDDIKAAASIPVDLFECFVATFNIEVSRSRGFAHIYQILLCESADAATTYAIFNTHSDVIGDDLDALTTMGLEVYQLSDSSTSEIRVRRLIERTQAVHKMDISDRIKNNDDSLWYPGCDEDEFKDLVSQGFSKRLKKTLYYWVTTADNWGYSLACGRCEDGYVVVDKDTLEVQKDDLACNDCEYDADHYTYSWVDSGFECMKNCTCTNGEPVDEDECDEHDFEECQSCDSGFTLNSDTKLCELDDDDYGDAGVKEDEEDEEEDDTEEEDECELPQYYFSGLNKKKDDAAQMTAANDANYCLGLNEATNRPALIDCSKNKNKDLIYEKVWFNNKNNRIIVEEGGAAESKKCLSLSLVKVRGKADKVIDLVLRDCGSTDTEWIHMQKKISGVNNGKKKTYVGRMNDGVRELYTEEVDDGSCDKMKILIDTKLTAKTATNMVFDNDKYCLGQDPASKVIGPYKCSLKNVYAKVWLSNSKSNPNVLFVKQKDTSTVKKCVKVQNNGNMKLSTDCKADDNPSLFSQKMLGGVAYLATLADDGTKTHVEFDTPQNSKKKRARLDELEDHDPSYDYDYVLYDEDGNIINHFADYTDQGHLDNDDYSGRGKAARSPEHGGYLRRTANLPQVNIKIFTFNV